MAEYSLLPFRFKRLRDRFLVVSEGGEHAFLPVGDFYRTVTGQLDADSGVYQDLVARHILREGDDDSFLPIIASQVRSRNMPSLQGVSLHIVVVTLRCDHGCPYCQVSRQGCGQKGFDLPWEFVDPIVDRIFESMSAVLTIEFQGGESLLAFDRIVRIIQAVENRNRIEGRSVRFVIASTLHHLTDEVLRFCRDHDVYLSTSLDGPAELHDQNRPLRGGSSHARTLAGIASARAALGDDHVSALTTLTRLSLSQPKAIIDEYVAQGFRSISLRPLSPYGFASRSTRQLGYRTEDFLSFYREAVDYIFELNRRGVRLEEGYLRLLAQRIFTSCATHYVDLSGLAGAGSAVLVYNYDGDIYVSDEARMLAEMGMNELRIGKVTDSLPNLPDTAAFALMDRDVLHFEQPGCSDCAYLPYCGADPVERFLARRRTGETRLAGGFCRRHMGLFDLIFEELGRPESDVADILLSWIGNAPRSVVPARQSAGLI